MSPDKDLAELELPPVSTIDTDSDGAWLGLSDEDGKSDGYVPSGDELNLNQEENSSQDGDSDALIAQLYQKLKAKKKEKKKVSSLNSGSTSTL